MIALTAKLHTYLVLGRVSNLPTVWTNVLAGAVLGGAAFDFVELVLLTTGVSALYVAGMFLNDAFDHRIDAVERMERPIPQGLASVREVFTIGFALLGLGVVLVAAGGIDATPYAIVLAVFIVLYDVWHEKNPLAPAVMGGCRALVYVTAAAAVAGALPIAEVALAGLALFAYVVGLTAVARFETKWKLESLWPLACLLAPVVIPAGGFGSLAIALRGVLLVWIALSMRLVCSSERGAIGRGVAQLIAGISWIDAILVADHDGAFALVAALAVPLTLLMQRRVPGT